jgi:glycine/D-amino acid oxidase-like deaminating enzyme
MVEGVGPPVISPDVLIIGGGVAGLWLLNDLHRDYATLLLERETLGGGQTCHSHVYIHRGHVYKESQADLITALQGVTETWNERLEDRQLRKVTEWSYFVWSNAADADQRAKLWSSFQLDGFQECRDDPTCARVFKRAIVDRAFRCPEAALNGEELVDALRRDVDQYIRHIQAVDHIEADTGDRRVKEIHITMAAGERLVIAPGALVLAAGRGNQALLDLVYKRSGTPPEVEGVGPEQQIRKAHMLVVKGELEPLAAVLPDLAGLFIVSRQCEDGQVAWLISDHRSELIKSRADWEKYDAQWWLPKVLEFLEFVAPRYFALADRPNLQWGVYEAPKAERKSSENEVGSAGEIPHEEKVEQFEFVNLFVIWPTKLTLAPKTSEEVRHRLHAQRTITTPNPYGQENSLPTPWTDSWQKPETGVEYWKRPGTFMSWDEFRDRYQL